MNRRVQIGDFAQITPVTGVFSSNIYQIKSLKSDPPITITLQHIDDPSNIETLIISDTITLQGRSDPVQIQFEDNSNKFLETRSSRQIQSGPIQFAMTGIKPIDINILVQMDDQTLTSACRIDKYISTLCKDPQLWESRVKTYYPGADVYKDENKSWKDYYYHLMTTMEDTMIDIMISIDDQLDYREDDSEWLEDNSLNRAAIRGYLDVLRWLMQDVTDIDLTEVANSAAYGGHLNILQSLASLDPPILPDERGANDAAGHGHLHILQWLGSLNPPILPDADGPVGAAAMGHVNTLQWMANLNPPNLIDGEGVDLAVKNGHLNVLQWAASLNPPILPDPYVSPDIAATEGYVDILQWMASSGLTHEISLDNLQRIAGTRNGLEVYKWLDTVDPQFLPEFLHGEGTFYYPSGTRKINYNNRPDPMSSGAAGFAAHKGNLEILQWLNSRTPPVKPTTDTANWAAVGGRLEVLKWMASLNPPVLPDVNGANGAFDRRHKKGREEVLQWMASQNPPILPDKR